MIQNIYFKIWFYLKREKYNVIYASKNNILPLKQYNAVLSIILIKLDKIFF